MMTEYKELQIVKHALQHYIKREGADPADIETEKRLLKEIERRIAWRQEKYGINPDKNRRATDLPAPPPAGPSWVDDADTFLCPYCRYEHHNPNLLPDKGKYCPHCKHRVRWDI